MKTIQKQYTKEIHKQLGYWGTWLPSTQLNLGDIGIIRNNVFHPISSLKKENISFSISRKKEEVSHEYASKDAVDIQNKLAGDAILPNSMLNEAEAGMQIDFKCKAAIYFNLNRAKTSHIEHSLALEKEIITRFENGEWEKDWVFITELITATECTVLISNGSNAKIEFKIDSDIEGFSNLNIGSKHQLVYEKNIAYKMLSENKTTPLFKIRGISGNWFGKKIIKPKSVLFEKSIIQEKQIKLIDIEPENFN